MALARRLTRWPRAACGAWARGVAGTPGAAVVTPLAATSARGELWDLLEYNAYYFNPHRMAPILAQVLEEPRGEALVDPRLEAYLTHATASVRMFEQLKDVTAKDVATSVAFARQLGHPAAEALSDAIVATVAAQLHNVTLQRVSFYITAFAKRKLHDASFWRTAASAVAEAKELVTPQVLVSLFDAFRKSGLRSERLYLALSKRVYDVLDDLGPGLIPPIVATICRVPLGQSDREQVIRALLGRWLAILRHEREHETGAIDIQQVLSLTISLGLAPEEINTAVFARDVAAYVRDRFDMLGVEEIIVFLWGMQRLVVPGTLTQHFLVGLQRVLKIWPALQNSGQLSLQRLVQLSDVVTATGQDTKWHRDVVALQDAVIADLSDSVQYCDNDSLAELLEIWAGGPGFWKRYPDFGMAVTKRIEELLLESADLASVIAVLQAALSATGLLGSLPPGATAMLRRAFAARGGEDRERLRAVVAGSAWEPLCGASSRPSSGAGVGAEDGREATAAAVAAAQPPRGGFRPLRGGSDLEAFLSSALAAPQDADGLIRALEVAAPAAGRLALAGGPVLQVFQLLESICDRLAASASTLPAARRIPMLRACAVAGLPHDRLFAVTAASVLAQDAVPLTVVDALEAAAALRLDIPELQGTFEEFMDEGLERRLTATKLARLLASAARLGFLRAEHAQRLLDRLLTIASPLRAPSADTLATLCHGLYLSGWSPGGHELWQLAMWLSIVDDHHKSLLHSFVLRNFAMAVLSTADGRSIVDGFPPNLQSCMARLLRGAPDSQRAAVSDTTLKFRHEVAEVLRRAGRAYDLDLGFGQGLAVELVTPGSSGTLWLLDGPECFHHPLLVSSGSGEHLGLRLVPAERRRCELLHVALDADRAAALEQALARWEAAAPAAGDEDGQHPTLSSGTKASPSLPPLFGSAAVRQQEVPTRLARMDWLSWAELSPAERLAALAEPGPRRVVAATPGAGS